MSIMDMRPITVDVDNGVYETVVVLTDVPSELVERVANSVCLSGYDGLPAIELFLQLLEGGGFADILYIGHEVLHEESVPSEIFPKEKYLVVYREIEDIR